MIEINIKLYLDDEVFKEFKKVFEIMNGGKIIDWGFEGKYKYLDIIKDNNKLGIICGPGNLIILLNDETFCDCDIKDKPELREIYNTLLKIFESVENEINSYVNKLKGKIVISE
jgi:hypothetical protein